MFFSSLFLPPFLYFFPSLCNNSLLLVVWGGRGGGLIPRCTSSPLPLNLPLTWHGLDMTIFVFHMSLQIIIGRFSPLRSFPEVFWHTHSLGVCCVYLFAQSCWRYETGVQGRDSSFFSVWGRIPTSRPTAVASCQWSSIRLTPMDKSSAPLLLLFVACGCHWSVPVWVTLRGFWLPLVDSCMGHLSPVERAKPKSLSLHQPHLSGKAFLMDLLVAARRWGICVAGLGG